MLKISTTEAVGGIVTLQLDGQVSGRWVELLQTTCEAQLKKGARVIVDLKNVSFADRDGIALLRSLADRRVEILNALPFIAEQIRKVNAKLMNSVIAAPLQRAERNETQVRIPAFLFIAGRILLRRKRRHGADPRLPADKFGVRCECAGIREPCRRHPCEIPGESRSCPGSHSS